MNNIQNDHQNELNEYQTKIDQLNSDLVLKQEEITRYKYLLGMFQNQSFWLQNVGKVV